MEALERLHVTPACHCDECSGDARAPTAAQLARLVRANRDRLLALARRRDLAPEEAFDCVQEAFQTYLRIPQARAIGDEAEDGARLFAAIVLDGGREIRRHVGLTSRPKVIAMFADRLTGAGESAAAR